MRNAKKIGLTADYSNCERTIKIVRHLMTLPMLPSTHIKEVYDDLIKTIPDNLPLLKLFGEYVGKQWMNSSTFTLSSLSVYGLDVRTNNDQEGYHSKINSSPPCKLNLY